MTHQVMPVIGEELGLGDHAAFFFKSNDERLAVVIPYIVRGLRNFERCVYIADENTVPGILGELKQAGVDIEAATASGALSVVTKHDTYLRHGIFELERMITDLDRDVKLALHSGFWGLRVTGEMSWALDLPSALGQLCEYEQELCRRWPTQLGGLCQYNESLFPADLVERMLGCHCVTMRDGNIVRHHCNHADPSQS
jgi:hypothetical protein